jgi:protein-glutamine gamma-glutamyltransferase
VKVQHEGASVKSLPWMGWQERAARLPRDTRDTLFNIAVVAWTVAPHLLHLSWWCSAMSVGP